ncbi:MAG: hypothetical protein LYZ66_01805 [Nitrososphaerales archaeon]|nr:hypothetical protein [Nitrososphaerales archaeon]
MPSLVDAVSVLDKAVATFIGEKSKNSQQVLSAVFRVNNEIGKLPASRQVPSLRALQHAVNEVTVAAKRGDVSELRGAMERVKECLAGTSVPG